MNLSKPIKYHVSTKVEILEKLRYATLLTSKFLNTSEKQLILERLKCIF